LRRCSRGRWTSFEEGSKTSAPGSAEPQLRNDYVSFWSVKAELGLRGPRREGPVFFKIWSKLRSLRETLWRVLRLGGGRVVLGFDFVAAGFEHAIKTGNVIEGEAFALVLAPDDVAQFDEVFEGRFGVISPDGLAFQFGLELPPAAKALGSGLSFFAVFGNGFPDMDVSHGSRLPRLR